MLARNYSVSNALGKRMSAVSTSQTILRHFKGLKMRCRAGEFVRAQVLLTDLS